MATKQLYDLGDMPPLGEVPEKMHAFLVRQERFGDPIKACVFKEDKRHPDGGSCMNTIFRGGDYNDLMNRKWDPTSEPDTYDHTRKLNADEARADGFN